MKIIIWLTLVIATHSHAKNSNMNTMVTVSGISSGAFMANQMSVIYSDKISGVGLVAGGFYGCAGNHFQEMYNLSRMNGTGDLSVFSPGHSNPFYQSVTECMKNPNHTNFNSELIQNFYQKNLVSDPQNITKQKIYIYHGENDSVISPIMKNKIDDMYSQLNLPDAQIFRTDSKGGHNFPTDQKKLNTCRTESVPYVSSCEKNVAGELLNFLIGPNLIRTPSKTNSIFKIQQKNHPDSIANYGYLASGQFCILNPDKCKLHVVFHGCEMSDNYDSDFDSTYQKFALLGYLQMRDFSEILPMSPLPYIEQKKDKMGLLQFVKKSGYVDYVEKNNLMVLFPQTQINKNSYPYNPKGCWDWIGTTGANYLTNQGVEPAWLINFISQIKQTPGKYILSK